MFIETSLRLWKAHRIPLQGARVGHLLIVRSPSTMSLFIYCSDNAVLTELSWRLNKIRGSRCPLGCLAHIGNSIYVKGEEKKLCHMCVISSGGEGRPTSSDQVTSLKTSVKTVVLNAL